MTYLWASILLLCNAIAWGTTFMTLPGNWLMLVFTVVYALVLPPESYPRLSWSVIAISLMLAVLGEVWEFVAGAAGAARHGGSRRGAIMAIAGSLIGSLAGAMIGVPLPVVGPMIGALGGGAIGAFAGAYFGERDRRHQERLAIGKGAMIGRLLGTAGKLAFGLLMLIIISVDSFADW